MNSYYKFRVKYNILNIQLIVIHGKVSHVKHTFVLTEIQI
jgi:hypothetical protein